MTRVRAVYALSLLISLITVVITPKTVRAQDYEIDNPQNLNRRTAKSILTSHPSIPEINHGTIPYEGTKGYFASTDQHIARETKKRCIDYIYSEGFFEGSYKEVDKGRGYIDLNVRGEFTEKAKKYIVSKHEIESHKFAKVLSCQYEIERITGILKKGKEAEVEFKLSRSVTPLYCADRGCSVKEKEGRAYLVKYDDGWRVDESLGEPRIAIWPANDKESKLRIPSVRETAQRDQKSNQGRKIGDVEKLKKIEHGDHVHYVHPNREPGVPISRFPTTPPGPGEYLTPDGRIVEQ